MGGLPGERRDCFKKYKREYRYLNSNRSTCVSYFRALSEFERSLIVERTHAGLTAARQEAVKEEGLNL
jgi:hypothetical protein